jgi:fluoride exporter
VRRHLQIARAVKLMLQLLVIGAGGFLGSILRYLVSGFVQNTFWNFTFPLGTAVVNLSGCFIIGFLTELAEGRGFLNDPARAFFVIGVLGGYTTFSSFGNETINLFRSGESYLALGNIAIEVLLGLACVWFGREFAQLTCR